jgi:FkbM family methyltransferase
MNNKEYTEIEARGVKFKLHTYNRSLELCARMNYETENLDFIDQLPENCTLYDLGACEGRFSIYAIKKGVKVISFEPDKNNFKVLSANLDLNSLSKDGLFNVGVGEKNSEAILQIGQPWPGGHQKVVKHDDVRSDLNFKFVDSETIQIVSLDSFIESEKIPFPNALKIDIDGSEVPFLKGSQRTLKDSRLERIIFELDIKDPNFGYITNTLSECGFREVSRYEVPNEPSLFNIIYVRI